MMGDLKIPNGSEIRRVVDEYPEDKCTENCVFKNRLMKRLARNTVCYHKVPTVFHEPFIIRGYRAIEKSWLYYLSSVCQLHNETMNVWSHILGLIIVLKKMHSSSLEMNFFTDPYSWPLMAGFMSAILLFTLSSFAHCFQSKSELVHYTAFMFDYAGVGLYSLSSAVMFLEYTSTKEYFNLINPVFNCLSILLATTVCIGCCVSKSMYEKPYPFIRKLWQIVPIAGTYILIIAPVVNRIFICFTKGQCLDTLSTHVQHIVWFLTSGFFFASTLPECWASPGACDHFFASHQLFHFAIMCSVLKQFESVTQDFKAFEHEIRSRPVPTFFSAFGSTIFVWNLELVCILYFHLKIRKKLAFSFFKSSP